MTRVQWVEGDEAGARAALAKGGAVIVAKEFRVARGLGLGDKITLGKKGADGRGAHEFVIVGVVTSPGLDIASKFFDIGEGYVDQAISSVFGSRADLIAKFGNDSVSLVQIGFAPGADPEETMRAVRALRGTGILAGGTATAMKAEVRDFLSAGLRVFSLIAIAAMVVASLGVANVIVAGVQARAFEMGVLRATGATRWMLARLVLGEALIIGLAAAVLGTLLGVQGTWGGHAVTASSIGIQLPIRLPAGPTAWAALAAVVITLLAALPPALALARRQPRELLGVVRG
jgi:putative ABC transport system permease protein